MRDSELIRRWIDLISQLSFPAVKVGFGFELGRGGGAEGETCFAGSLERSARPFIPPSCSIMSGIVRCI